MSDTTQKAADSMVGKVLAGRYEVVKKLGAGGMGAVDQGRQMSLDRMVALKVIHAGIADNPDAGKRFDREMQATAKIEHANTIRVYDYGQTDDGQLYLAMEFLPGRTLSAALADGAAMPLDRIVRIGAQV